MSGITYKDVESKLLSLDKVTESLNTLEPLETRQVDTGNDLKFSLYDTWDMDITFAPLEQTVGSFKVDGEKFPISKEAVLSASSNAGIPVALAKKMPTDLFLKNLNFFYGKGMEDKEYNTIISQGKVSAFTRPTVDPYSNVHLLESVVESVQDKYGKDTKILADYKFNNTFGRTDVRLIIPGEVWAIPGTNMPDVPTGQTDDWNVGIHLSNSLTGKTQTVIETYLFRWWCTNGAVTIPLIEDTRWRRNGEDTGEVYEWAYFQTKEVLGTMDAEFERIINMSKTILSDEEVTLMLESALSAGRIPAAQRTTIAKYLEEFDGELTMYVVMQAITRAANNGSLSYADTDRLMRLGGAIPTYAYNPAMARAWVRGTQAEEGEKNPFEAPVG